MHVRRFNTVDLASDAYTKPSERRVEQLRRTAQFLSSLDVADQREVAAMLRVDHSGEIAANTIYEAQADVFGFQGKRQEKDLIIVCLELTQEMWENERKHLKATSAMLDEYQTRPSALVPLWALTGRVLGGATAMMGEKSAMACTEAVETVIGEHYDEYVFVYSDPVNWYTWTKLAINSGLSSRERRRSSLMNRLSCFARCWWNSVMTNSSTSTQPSSTMPSRLLHMLYCLPLLPTAAKAQSRWPNVYNV